MKKETALKYENILNDNSNQTFWADYDSFKGKWYIYNSFRRRFYTVKELKKYLGDRL